MLAGLQTLCLSLPPCLWLQSAGWILPMGSHVAPLLMAVLLLSAAAAGQAAGLQQDTLAAEGHSREAPGRLYQPKQSASAQQQAPLPQLRLPGLHAFLTTIFQDALPALHSSGCVPAALGPP